MYAARHLQPTHAVHVGDLLDLYSASRFPNSLNIMTPEREAREGRRMAVQMWKDVQAASKGVECFQLHGNHEDRAYKTLMRNAPALEKLFEKPLADMLRFDGVTTLGSSLDELEIGGTLFHHGWSCNPGFHVRHFLKSVVHGHTHHAGVQYLRAGSKTLYELDCGVMADFNARPMLYRASVTCKWTTGFGWIDGWGPRFCPI